MPVVWRFSIAQGKNYCSLQSIDSLTRWRRKTTTTTPSKVFQWKQNLINPSVQHKAFHWSVLQWTKRKTRKNKTWRLTHLPSSVENVCNSSRHFSSPLNPKTETPGTREQREGSKTLLFLLLLLLLLEWKSSRVANFMSKAYKKKKKQSLLPACGIQRILQNNRWVRACLFVQHPKRFVENSWAHLRRCPRSSSSSSSSSESTSAATRAQKDLCSWYRFSQKLSETRFARSSCGWVLVPAGTSAGGATGSLFFLLPSCKGKSIFEFSL